MKKNNNQKKFTDEVSEEELNEDIDKFNNILMDMSINGLDDDVISNCININIEDIEDKINS